MHYRLLLSVKVVRAPAALNVAADTGWDTDWLRLERAWTRKWRILLCEDGNKTRSVNYYAVVVVDFFLFRMRFRLGCCSVSHIFVFN